MECNKDDAIKATELAEKKYASRDLAGAKKFCAKALQLFPGLERAKQLLAVVEVHSAAEVRLEGLEDWYGVLQVDPHSDAQGIRKQYRKLALTLHPDKNSLPGAEPAFKLINEAWMILSDTQKKISYDEKRVKVVKKHEARNGAYSEPPHSQPSSSTNNPNLQTQKPVPEQQPQATQNGQPTFWTQCPGCKIQYQYYRKFENFQLLCHRCKTGFVATDIGVPPSGPAMPVQKKSKVGNGESLNGGFDQKLREKEERRKEEERRRIEKEREREEKRRLKETLRRAKEEDRRKEILEKQMLKQREREEKEARKRQMEALKKKLKRKLDDDEEEEDDDEEEELESDEEGGTDEHLVIPPEILRFGLRRSNRTRRNVVYRDDYDDEDGDGPCSKKARVEEEGELLQMKRELAEQGRELVRKFLQALNADAEKEDGKEAEPEESEELERSDEEESHFLVPDPDFHNFDRDRKEETVSEGQVWALYDDSEGMPRFYCEVKMVVSVKPFKVRIRWLERYEGVENAEELERAGFVVTCGKFKCKRKTETEEHFNKFSHLMDVERQGNVFKIFPGKGEVWAVYRELEVKEVRYEMVEVVSGYLEEFGITVLPLVKVEGFKTIFARGSESLRTFQSRDLMRFSHKVPAHWMTGREKANAPRDCWELDTAATPSHLIFRDR